VPYYRKKKKEDEKRRARPERREGAGSARPVSRQPSRPARGWIKREGKGGPSYPKKGEHDRVGLAIKISRGTGGKRGRGERGSAPLDLLSGEMRKKKETRRTRTRTHPRGP